MYDNSIYDYALDLINRDATDVAFFLLVGQLHSAKAAPQRWDEAYKSLQEHPLRAVLLEDPSIARCVAKPRGYAGDAELIDMIYEMQPPEGISHRGEQLFQMVVGSPTCEAVRLRKEEASRFLEPAVNSGKRILSLACGHFREGSNLIGRDLSQIDLVDQDPLSLAKVRETYGDSVNCHQLNVFKFLHQAAGKGAQYDLVYTLGLTDYFDDRAMDMLYQMVGKILAPGGTFTMANFIPHHLTVGWMEAVMEWHLIYRSPEELTELANRHEFKPETWLDPTGTIAWCRMQRD